MVRKEKIKNYLNLYTLASGLTCVFVFWLVMFFDFIFAGEGIVTFDFNKYGERNVELIFLSVAMIGYLNIFVTMTKSKLVIIYLSILFAILSLLYLFNVV